MVVVTQVNYHSLFPFGCRVLSRPIVACFDVFGSDSVAVWGFAFFEFVDCSSQLFCRDLWDFSHLIGVVVVHIGAALIFRSLRFVVQILLLVV